MKLKLKLYNFKTAHEKINLSKVNSHNKVIYGIINTLISYTGNAEWRNKFREDHHSYKCNFGTVPNVPNHSYSHSPISTAAGQLAWQFLRDCGGKQLDVMWPRSN